MEENDNMQEQRGNVSREMETLKKKSKANNRNVKNDFEVDYNKKI